MSTPTAAQGSEAPEITTVEQARERLGIPESWHYTTYGPHQRVLAWGAHPDAELEIIAGISELLALYQYVEPATIRRAVNFALDRIEEPA